MGCCLFIYYRVSPRLGGCRSCRRRPLPALNAKQSLADAQPGAVTTLLLDLMEKCISHTFTGGKEVLYVRFTFLSSLHLLVLSLAQLLQKQGCGIFSLSLFLNSISTLHFTHCQAYDVGLLIDCLVMVL